MTIETPLYPLSEFTPEEAAKVAEFEAAETPAEVLREQVAQAMFQAAMARARKQGGGSGKLDPEDTLTEAADVTHDWYLAVADAALAVFRGQQDPAVQRVLALVRDSDGDEYVHGAIGDSCPACWAEDIRAAIGGDGR